MVCAGIVIYGQATPPDDRFASVDAGKAHTCGLRADGHAVCWGCQDLEANFGQCVPP